MDFTPGEIHEIEKLLEELDTLDPSELPVQATRLVDLLNHLLDPEEE